MKLGITAAEDLTWAGLGSRVLQVARSRSARRGKGQWKRHWGVAADAQAAGMQSAAGERPVCVGS